MSILGEYIRKSRIIANMTQGDVGKKMGNLTAQFVSKIERGETGLPAEHIMALARAIDARPIDLKDVMMMDYEERLDRSMRKQTKKKKRPA